MVRKKTGKSGGADTTPTLPMPLMEFGRRLDTILLDKGLSQADLWRRTGQKVSKDTISKWVNGQSAPSILNLRLIAQALRMTTDDIYPGYEQHVQAQKGTKNVRRNYDPNLVASGRAEGILISPDMLTAEVNIFRRVSGATAMQIAELLKNDAID